jgi:hypothetical protein
MPDDFRAEVRQELDELLSYWREIELWIKRAEQVNGRAVIPAINELRYASRQLFNAMRIFEKPELTPGDKHAIQRRFAITSQYLHNADHDVCDAIIGFYRGIVSSLDDIYGPTNITLRFPEYPLLRKVLNEGESLVADSRKDYEARKNNYGRLKREHIPHLIDSYNKLLDAEVSAKEEQERVQIEVRKAEAKAQIYGWFAILGTGASIISIPLSVYLWISLPQDFCKTHSTQFIARSVCAIGSFSDTPPLTGPTSGATSEAPPKPP